jgi:hypothetical protein
VAGYGLAVPTSWRIVAGVGLVTGIAEFIDSFFIGWGAIASLTFSALFFLGLWLTLRLRLLGPILIGVMSALEIAVFPGLKRTTTFDWLLQVSVLIVSATGVLAAVIAVLQRRARAPST